MKEGIFENVSPSDYYGIGLSQAVSYSSVSAFASEPTPRHFYARTVDKDAPPRGFNPAFYQGSMFHSLCEIGEERFFERNFMLPKEVRRGSAEFLRLHATNQNRKPVREQDLGPVLAMYRNLARTKPYQHIAKKAKHEVSMFWRYNDYFLKGRMDVLLPGGLILDFKTTKDANPFTAGGFQNSIEQYNYAAQAAFYTWGMKELTGITHRFAIAAVEKVYPYECAFFEITTAQMKDGMDAIRPHLDQLISCLKTGNWGDGYGETFHTKDSLGKRADVNIQQILEGEIV